MECTYVYPNLAVCHATADREVAIFCMDCDYTEGAPYSLCSDHFQDHLAMFSDQHNKFMIEPHRVVGSTLLL